jgi:hypothetical protein
MWSQASSAARRLEPFALAILDRPYRAPAALGVVSSTLASRRNFAASSGGVGLM